MDTVQELVALIQTNQERFYRIAYTYVKNREDALDLVHDAVVKALQSCPALKNPAYMRTWFYRILINESLSFLRKRKNVLSWEEIPAQAAPDARQEEYIDLYAAIDKLPADLKTVVILRFFEDMKLEAIADITSANLNTTKSRLYRALKLLKLDMEVLDHD
jgi:RNA polymerase sigma-70 factor (ECF subfamily)